MPISFFLAFRRPLGLVGSRRKPRLCRHLFRNASRGFFVFFPALRLHIFQSVVQNAFLPHFFCLACPLLPLLSIPCPRLFSCRACEFPSPLYFFPSYLVFSFLFLNPAWNSLCPLGLSPPQTNKRPPNPYDPTCTAQETVI